MTGHNINCLLVCTDRALADNRPAEADALLLRVLADDPAHNLALYRRATPLQRGGDHAGACAPSAAAASDPPAPPRRRSSPPRRGAGRSQRPRRATCGWTA